MSQAPIERVTTEQARDEQGRLHALGRPAVKDTTGKAEFWMDGLRHNPSGPAVVWPGHKDQYWLFGFRVEEPIFLTWKKLGGDSVDSESGAALVKGLVRG